MLCYGQITNNQRQIVKFSNDHKILGFKLILTGTQGLLFSFFTLSTNI